MRIDFSGEIESKDKEKISSIISSWRHANKTRLFHLNLKKEDKPGRVRYEIELNVSTSAGRFSSAAQGWILSLAMKRALRKIERQFTHKERSYRDDKKALRRLREFFKR